MYEWMNDIVYERAKHTIIFSRYTRTRQIFKLIVHTYRLQFRSRTKTIIVIKHDRGLLCFPLSGIAEWSQ